MAGWMEGMHCRNVYERKDTEIVSYFVCDWTDHMTWHNLKKMLGFLKRKNFCDLFGTFLRTEEILGWLIFYFK